MSFRDDYDLDLLVNELETVVIDEIEKQFNTAKHRDACRCQDCVLDIAALALNKLKPYYRSSLSYKGVLYKQKYHTEKIQKSVEKVVSESIDKVKDNPPH